MIPHVIALLNLFQPKMPDRETIEWVLELASDANKWPNAHNVFQRIRDRNLAAIEANDGPRQCQYCFEETCLKAIYNETDTQIPCDSDSSYWIVPLAIDLAGAVEVPVQSVIDIVASR